MSRTNDQHLRPPALRIAACLSPALLVATLAGCSSADPRWSPDCVSPFHFDGREYLVGPSPPDVERMTAGARLGEGASESCGQYGPGVHSGGDELTDPRPVYAFPDVPPEQAIVLLRPDGPPAVLLAADKPDGGWDPDLRAWLKNSR